MINNIIKTGALGCMVFTVFLLFMAYSGMASSMRDEEGNFKKNKNFKSILGAIMSLCLILGLLFFANVKYANSLSSPPRFTNLWIHSFGVFFVIHLYDLLVLDYLIIVKWHPKFLNLPDTRYYKTIRPHVIGFFKGIPLGILASLMASLLFLWTL